MSASKWTCRVCTYENWPASIKCVICSSPKQAPRIEDEIYKLALTSGTVEEEEDDEEPPAQATIEEVVSPPDSEKISTDFSVDIIPPHSHPSPPLPSVGETRIKWSCTVCTYLNWPKARKCIQCRTPRSRRASPTLGAQSSSPSPSSADQLTPVVTIQHQQQHKLQDKWICRKCTYENWPKNHHCVMCNASREPSPTREASNRDEEESIGSASAAIIDNNTRRGGNSVAPWSEDTWRRVKTSVSSKDWLWLNACRGAVEGDLSAVDAYLADGGSVNRKMTKADCRLLNRAQAYEAGMTLTKLAVKFQREDLIDLIVSSLEKSALTSTRKRMPCHISPELATDIRRHFAINLRQRKGDFACYYVFEHNTFALPAEIETLPQAVQEHLFTELLDPDVQKELELEEKAINWWTVSAGEGSRLFALWNRTAGDCLLDSVLQAAWGILDRDNTLRTAMADSLRDGQAQFFSRWREYEAAQALTYQYTLDEYQWQRDWENLLTTACQPGESLEQAHIFTLCHILRRPIIVYGVKYINNLRSEPIGIANFQGVYLPLLWERPFCSKNPIILGYTRGHFSALVPIETGVSPCRGAGALTNDEVEFNTIYLPVMDPEGNLLPVHFINAEESRHQESLLRDWLDCCHTRRGLLMVRMRLGRRQPLVGQMLDEWLDSYRRMTMFGTSSPTDPISASVPHNQQQYSSFYPGQNSGQPPDSGL